LRPVTFRYKADAAQVLQYGLIAEEVSTVLPELVFRDAKGQIASVRYEQLTPMLLKQWQVQRKQIEEQQVRLNSDERTIQAQQEKLERLEQKLAKVVEINARLESAIEGLQAEPPLADAR
jgi:hypothetical protein